MQEQPSALAPVEAKRRALEIIEDLQRKQVPTVEPYLPLLLQLNGKPYSLGNYFPFTPMFRTRLPRTRVLKTARQVAKSTYLAAAGLLFAAKIPYSIQLFLTPLFEQIRRFSTNYMAPFIDESLVRHLFVDATCNQSVLQRTFTNRSLMHFSYAWLSASRVRGIGGVMRTYLDEIQDLDGAHLPIIRETMSAAPAPWGLLDMTGTPKGFDNPIQKYWGDSSQAEWFIHCPHAACGHWNICSTEYDLLKMIGPPSEDISPEKPGIVCAKCRKPVDPRTGHWEHRFPELRWQYQGFHIPQPIMPMHYTNKTRWAELCAKMQGRGNVAPNVFHNEVLGESYDQGSKLLTKSELQAACSLPIDNNPSEIPTERIAEARPYYDVLVLGIDWGGGGGDGVTGYSEKARRQRVSFTTVAIMGIRRDRRIDVLWGRRLLTPNDHAREAAEILAIFNAIRPNYIAHDFTGAGALRETLLVQAGVAREMFVGFDYKNIPTGVIMQFQNGDEWDRRPFWRVDKTRTLQTTINALKFGMVRLFRYDNRGSQDPGLLDDFLALTEEKVETTAGDRYIIRRLASMPDDFAHAVNVGCCTLWHHTQSWPDFVRNARRSPGDVGGQW